MAANTSGYKYNNVSNKMYIHENMHVYFEVFQ